MREVAPTRHSVIAAARLWLDGRDPAEVSARELARALGMVPTALYRYFDSTEDLQAALRDPARTPPVVRPTPPPHTRRFAEAFVARAAGPVQTAAVIARLVGDTVTVGPEQVGPRGRATAVATGRVGRVSVARLPGGAGSRMLVTVPVALDIEVQLGQKWVKRFDAKVAVPLRIDPVIVDPLQLHIDVTRPQPRDIVVDVELGRLSVALLQAVGNIDGLLREKTLEFVAEVLDSPEAQAATRIDLGQVIDDAWHAGLVFPN